MNTLTLQAPPDSFSQTHRQAVCDAQGYFTFEDLPAGEYFVVTSVTWVVGSSSLPEGGWLMQRVRVEAGRARRVVLAP